MTETGLDIIFDSDNDGAPAEIDIVAVHGLNFKNSVDHARGTWMKNGQLWLRDNLPEHLPKPGRVMLFAYNSSPAMGAAATKLDGHAKNLLQWLKLRRKSTPERPLVFICHSLGGLVVKEALVEASLDSTYRPIVEATCLLVFFATPHRGGNYASVGEVAAKLVRSTLFTPRNDFIESLKSDSNLATKRFNQSRHLNEKFLIISFYEGQPYGKLGIIVDERSATLNLAGTRETQVPIDADHSSICKFAAADNSTCEFVIGTIVMELERALELKPLPSRDANVNVHWCGVPRSVNVLFTGRRKILKQLKDALSPGKRKDAEQQNRFVITGPGGMGKSEICLRFADQMREAFWGIFWVDVSSDSTAIEGFLRISNILGSTAEDINDTCQLLSNLKDEWLLVLDNADDPKTDYQRYFPVGKYGKILMTSRIPECSRYGTVGSKELGNLDEENEGDCLLLLLRAAEISEDSRLEREPAAKAVIELLGFHTLALIQAGAYIARGYCSMDRYPVEYQRECERLLKFNPGQARSRYCNVYATFEASTRILESSKMQEDQDAVCLLNLLSVTHYDNVPLEIFEDAWKGSQRARRISEDNSIINELSIWHVSQLPEFIQANLDNWDSFRVLKAQNQLYDLALIKKGIQSGAPTISVHPLTHDWVKVRQDQCWKSQSWLGASCILALSHYGSPYYRPYDSHLRLHLHSLLKNERKGVPEPAKSVRIIQTLFQCGELLKELRDDAELACLLKEVFHDLGANPEEPSQGLLPLYTLASWNLYYLGKVLQAVNMLTQVVNIQQTTIAEDHPDQLASQSALATAYEANGQIRQAVQLLEHVVKVEETSLAEDHPHRLESQHELARIYEANGQTKQAIQLLEHVVKVEETSLAEDHPDRLASQQVLARAYQSNGQTKEAIQLLEHVIKVRVTLLAEDHPLRLESQQVLASTYREIGQNQAVYRATGTCKEKGITHLAAKQE
ncbi:hypothetical protein RU639_013582 [Aspergillus parasiticus]